MPDKYAIIVAGGSGIRMGSPTPKQFLEIGGKPILMHTLEVFAHSDPAISLVLVLPEKHFSLWKELCEKHRFKIPHQLVKGGETRFQSVKNGLDLLPDTGLVAVHDGVRPLVAESVIKRSFEVALEQGNAVTSLPLKETIRELKAGSVENTVSRDRSQYRLVQTPQTFSIALLKSAYQQPENPLFTDDASVVEQTGVRIHLIDGNEENIKITHKHDLLACRALLVKKSPA